jgi:hypothetical protein
MPVSAGCPGRCSASGRVACLVARHSKGCSVAEHLERAGEHEHHEGQPRTAWTGHVPPDADAVSRRVTESVPPPSSP